MKKRLAIGVVMCCLVPAWSAAATEPEVSGAVQPTSSVSSPAAPGANAPAPVSPYVLAARRHALAVGVKGPGPVVPPSQRRTRQAIGQLSQY